LIATSVASALLVGRLILQWMGAREVARCELLALRLRAAMYDPVLGQVRSEIDLCGPDFRRATGISFSADEVQLLAEVMDRSAALVRDNSLMVIRLWFSRAFPKIHSRLPPLNPSLQREKYDPEQGARPPRLACFLLELFLSPTLSEAVVGDLTELFERKYRRIHRSYGVLAAKAYFWWQVIRSAPALLPLSLRDAAKFVGVLKLLKVFERYWSAR
jgi:hypothetical protein